ncbi:MAG: tetratricopeptide repeat protein [Pseudomonadota bacterium]|nr:tetratricopeptide repeat protein [Pseudomonadota bacterium]
MPRLLYPCALALTLLGPGLPATVAATDLPTDSATQPGEADFVAGLQSYRAGQYNAALDAFNRAFSAGRSDAETTYYLGLTHLQLRQFDEARGYFELVVASGQNLDKAHFYLGQIALEQDKPAEAAEWFRRSLETATGGVAQAARAGLQQAEQRRPSLSGSRFAEFNLGYDSDVVFLPDSAIPFVFDQSAAFVNVYAGGFEAIGNSDYVFDIVLNATEYDGLSQGQNVGFGGGLSHEYQRWNWDFGWRLGSNFTFFGGEPYQGSPQLSLKAGRNDWTLFYDYNYYAALDSLFDFLDGSRHRAGFSRTYEAETWAIGAGYAYEINDLESPEASPRRISFTTGFNMVLDSNSTLSLNLGYQDIDYEAGPRVDERLQASLEVERRLGSNLDIHAAFTRVDNNSTVNSQDYERNIVTLGLGWGF